MRKTQKGWQLSIYLDDEVGVFLQSHADLDCRTPENLVKYILTCYVRDYQKSSKEL